MDGRERLRRLMLGACRKCEEGIVTNCKIAMRRMKMLERMKMKMYYTQH